MTAERPLFLHSDAELDAVADVIENAECPGRQGPFGAFDYGHNEDFYGPAPAAGRWVIRDFRDPASDDWGTAVHQTSDRDKHEEMFMALQRRHVADAVLRAVPNAGPRDTRVLRCLLLVYSEPHHVIDTEDKRLDEFSRDDEPIDTPNQLFKSGLLNQMGPDQYDNAVIEVPAASRATVAALIGADRPRANPHPRPGRPLRRLFRP